jgi:DNA-binding Lrp family transcriptional regulator
MQLNKNLDEKDKIILRAIQEDFALAKKPFQIIGEQLGMEEEEVIGRIKKLRDSGFIRKLGAVISPAKIGYVSLLAAINVPEDSIDSVAEIINSYSGVTHNYIREGEPNLWFTLTEPDSETLNRNLDEIQGRIEARIIKLPMTRKYKIGVKLAI